jgi:hypothetical protein
MWWIVLTALACGGILATLKQMAHEFPWWNAAAVGIILTLAYLAPPKNRNSDEDVAKEHA